MTCFRTLASGSSGNAALLSAGSTHLLIDMGISCRRICQTLSSLGLHPEDLSAVLITHEHSDHISGLATYIKKYHTPIVCTPGTAWQLRYRLAGVEPLLRPTPYGETFPLGDAEITLLPTSHDCSESSAFRIETASGGLGYLTDTGYILEETAQRLLGAELLVLESNHDVDMLRAGPYPFPLKQRVLGPQGHLSNDDAARYASASAQAGTRSIILAHLSKENNTPQAALAAVGQALEAVGYSGELTVAPRDIPGELHILERLRCSV